jgi:LemA protein
MSHDQEMKNSHTRRRSTCPSPRSGAIGKGCLIGLAALAAFALLLIAIAWSGYNSLVSGQEGTRQKWANVENYYKRRFELIPNLVETVKGVANFEQQTITQVTEARASVGRVQMPSDLPTDQAQLDQYVRAQQQLGSALSRLMVVAENYPELKATQNFLSLQDQLEGTENRIAVAREDYTVAVRTYNTSVRSFPKNVLAGMFNFEPLPQFTVAPEETVVPKVDFGTGK